MEYSTNKLIGLIVILFFSCYYIVYKYRDDSKSKIFKELDWNDGFR